MTSSTLSDEDKDMCARPVPAACVPVLAGVLRFRVPDAIHGLAPGEHVFAPGVPNAAAAIVPGLSLVLRQRGKERRLPPMPWQSDFLQCAQMMPKPPAKALPVPVPELAR